MMMMNTPGIDTHIRYQRRCAIKKLKEKERERKRERIPLGLEEDIFFFWS